MSTETKISKTQSDSFDTTKQKVDAQAGEPISANSIDTDTTDLSATLDASPQVADSDSDQSLADLFAFSAFGDVTSQDTTIEVTDDKIIDLGLLNHTYTAKGFVMDKGSLRDIKAVDEIKSGESDPSNLADVIKAGKSGSGFWKTSFMLPGSLDPKSLGFLVPVLVEKSGLAGNNWMPIKIDYENSRDLLNPKQFDKFKGSLLDQQEGYFDKSKVKVTNTNLNKGAKINKDDSVNEAKDSSILGKIGSFAAKNSRFVRGKMQEQLDAKDPEALAMNSDSDDSSELEGTIGKMASAFKVIASTYLTNFFPDTSFKLLDTNITGLGTFIEYSGMFQLIEGQDAVKITSSFNVETHDKNDVSYLGSSIEPISGLEIGNDYLKVKLINTGELFHTNGDQFKLKLDAPNWLFSILGKEFAVATAGNFYYDLNSKGFYGSFENLELGLSLFGTDSVFKFIGLGLTNNAIQVKDITSELSEFLLFDTLNLGPTTLSLLDIDSPAMRVSGSSELATNAPINFGGIELSEFGGAVSFDYQKGAKEVRISNGKASFKVGDFVGKIEDFSYSSKDNTLKAGSILVNGNLYDKEISLSITDFQITSQNLATFKHAEGSLSEVTFLEGKLKAKDIVISGSKSADQINLKASSILEAERLALADDSLALDNLTGSVVLSTDLKESNITLSEVNGLASMYAYTAAVNNLSYDYKEDNLLVSRASFNGKIAEGDFSLSVNNLSYSKDKGIDFKSVIGNLKGQSLFNNKVKLEEAKLSATKEGEALKLNGSSAIVAEEISAGPVTLNKMSGKAEFSHNKAEGTNISVSNFNMDATLFDTVFSLENLNYDYKSKKISNEKATALITVLGEEVTLTALGLSYQNSSVSLTSLKGTLTNLPLLDGKVQVSNVILSAADDLSTLSGSAAISASNLGNDTIKLNNIAGDVTVNKTEETSSISLANGSFSATALGFTGSGADIIYNDDNKTLTAKNAQLDGTLLGKTISVTAKDLKASKEGIDFSSIKGDLPAMELDFFSLGKASISSIPIELVKNGENVEVKVIASLAASIPSIALGVANIADAGAAINFSYNSKEKGIDYSFGEVSAADVKFNFWGQNEIGHAKTITYDKATNTFKAATAAINIKAPESISSSALIFTASQIELSKEGFNYEKAGAEWTGGEVNFDPFKLKAPNSIVIDKTTDSVLISGFQASFTSDLIGASGKASFRISNTGQLSAESISATIQTPTVQLLPEKIPGIWPFELRVDAPIVPGLHGTFALGAKGNAAVKVGGTIEHANNELVVTVEAMPSAALEIYLKAALTAGIPLLAEIQAYLKGSAKAAAKADSKISYSRTYSLVDNKMVHTKSDGNYSLNFDVSMALDAGINARILFWERNLYELNIKTWQLGTTEFSNTFGTFNSTELTPTSIAPKGFLESGKTPKIPLSAKPKGYTQGLVDIGNKFNMNLLNADTATSEAELNNMISNVKKESNTKSKDLLSRFKISKEERTYLPEQLLARNNDISDKEISKLVELRTNFETSITENFGGANGTDGFDLAAYQAKLKEFETNFSNEVAVVYARDISIFDYRVADEIFAQISALNYKDLIGSDKQPMITNGVDFIHQIESKAESKMAEFKICAEENRRINLLTIDEVKNKQFDQLFMGSETGDDLADIALTSISDSIDTASIPAGTDDIALIKTKKSLLAGIHNQQKKNTEVKEKEYCKKNKQELFFLNNKKAVSTIGDNKTHSELIQKRNVLSTVLTELVRKTSDTEIEKAFSNEYFATGRRREHQEKTWKTDKLERRNKRVTAKKIEIHANNLAIANEETRLNLYIYEYENLSKTWSTGFDKFIPNIEEAKTLEELTTIKQQLKAVFYGA